jgi:lipopolysaccharide export system permease protein
VAVLIGTLYALSTLARHSEITVLRTSGLSTRHILTGLFQIASVFALITFLLGELVAPPAERAANQLRMKAFSSVVAQEFRTGLWVKDERSFINVRTVLPDTRLRGIRIYEFDENAKLRSVSEAEEGEYVPPATWRLSGVVQTVLEGERATIEKKPDMLWRSALNPDILSVLLVVPERMSILHLTAYIRHLSENHQKTERYEIALWKKVIYPLAALVMVALALPFGYTHNRMAGVSLKIFSGVMIGIFFHMLNGLFSSLGVINSWSPISSALTPSILFLLTAMGMIWWVERR